MILAPHNVWSENGGDPGLASHFSARVCLHILFIMNKFSLIAPSSPSSAHRISRGPQLRSGPKSKQHTLLGLAALQTTYASRGQDPLASFFPSGADTQHVKVGRGWAASIPKVLRQRALSPVSCPGFGGRVSLVPNVVRRQNGRALTELPTIRHFFLAGQTRPLKVQHQLGGGNTGRPLRGPT